MTKKRVKSARRSRTRKPDVLARLSTAEAAGVLRKLLDADRSLRPTATKIATPGRGCGLDARTFARVATFARGVLHPARRTGVIARAAEFAGSPGPRPRKSISMVLRSIRVYDYVNQPYDRVVAAVRDDPEALFRAATDMATSRAHSVATALEVEVGGIAIRTPVTIDVGEFQEMDSRPRSRSSALKLRWSAAKHASLFPTMHATLSVYPLSPTETQLDLDGQYEPPLGLLGAAGDALVGHRVAEASVHRLVREMAKRLGQVAAP